MPDLVEAAMQLSGSQALVVSVLALLILAAFVAVA